ncbi:hypothetical protein SFRURICE_018508 [Spodoptera frugiperda]|nr:hypothetical protein SFRURICE_018508 [Spodoptera frugiperda]
MHMTPEPETIICGSLKEFHGNQLPSHRAVTQAKEDVLPDSSHEKPRLLTSIRYFSSAQIDGPTFRHQLSKNRISEDCKKT